MISPQFLADVRRALGLLDKALAAEIERQTKRDGVRALGLLDKALAAEIERGEDRQTKRDGVSD